MRYCNFIYKWSLLILIVCACLGCDTGYETTNNGVIFVTWDTGSGRVKHPLNGADRDSFRVIKRNLFAKDKSSVFHRYRVIENADPSSFRIIDERYLADDHRVYFLSYSPKEIPGADPKTFHRIGSEWSRDSNDVYVAAYPIESCDPATLTLLSKIWARDSQCAYATFNKLQDVHLDTFEVVSRGYAKDKNNVYAAFVKLYNKQNMKNLAKSAQEYLKETGQPHIAYAWKIDDSDPETFVVDEHRPHLGRDKERCYNRGEVIACN